MWPTVTAVGKSTVGPGLPDTATTWRLFDAGYAASFGGALEFVASRRKKDVKGTIMSCTPSVGLRNGGGFGSKDQCTGRGRR